MQRKHSFDSKATLAGVALLAAVGCANELQPEVGHGESPFLLANDVVLEWNQHAIDALTQADGYQDPVLASRTLAMVHVAMHDAVTASSHRFYRPYALRERDLAAHPVAAAASAAARVLVQLFPAQAGELDTKLQTSLGAVDDGPAEARGVALGERAGDVLLALRVQDGANESVAYTPSSEPGDYRPTRSGGVVYRPGWENVTPWGLARADQFRPEPPPALSSSEYAAAYEEVRSKGDRDSQTRTPDETAYAQFWYEFSELGWNRVARVTAAREQLGLAHTARLFALVNMALADAYIAGWDAKFHYDTWRPITAIHQGDADGNPATVADASFEPFLPTPPVQDYPSTHSALGAAAAEVLTRAFGKRGQNVGFSMTSSTASAPNVEVRSFETLAQAARENADSRVMAGIHFRFACEAGLALGSKVGAHVFENFLQRY